MRRSGKVKGLMFGDYYYVFAADKTDAKQLLPSAMLFSSAVCTSHIKSDIATDFAIRFRLEARDAGFAQGCEDGTLRQARLLTVEEGAR